MNTNELLILAALCVSLILASAESVRAQQSSPEVGILTRRGSELLMHGKPFRAVGLNKFDLALQYVKGGAEREKAARDIQDAAAKGFRLIRFGACMFYPKEMNAWARDDYWASLDAMFADARKAGLWLVPCLVWNTYLFPDMANETIRQMLTDKDSRSRQYVELYISEFVERYKNEPTILFWELWCELNLGADLEFMRPYGYHHLNVTEQGCPPARLRTDNFTTDQMIAFLRDLARLVKKIDPVHLISSGHSIPRPAAQHLRRKSGDWTPDSVEEAERYLRDIHPDPIDIISIHLYNFDFCQDNIRFGNTDKDSAVILRDYKRMADRIGKPIFLGEAGGQAFDDPGGAVPPFSKSIIKEMVEADYPVVAWWPTSLGDELRFDLDKMPELCKMLLEADVQLKKRAVDAGSSREVRP
ncbi:MAG: cellulase family glycosylhydrolase [Armatimonadota bacterium]